MKYNFFKIILLSTIVTTNSFSKEWDFLSVNGYGSLGLVYQNNKDVLYRSSLQTPKGSAGDLSFSNYSNLGLQIDAHATKDLTFTLQGILSENNNAEGLFELAWANAKYQVNNNLSVKVGKMRLAAFMDSDILDVAYSYDMVKLPSMYSNIPFQNYSGIEIQHQLNFDDISLISTLFYGQADSFVYNNYLKKADISLTEMKGVMLQLISNNLTLRFAFNKNNLKINKGKSSDEMNQLSALNIPIINQTLQKYKIEQIEYLALGGKYEWGNSYFKGEYIKLNTNSFLADMRSWYLNVGYEFENWSPYVLYSKSSSKSAFKGISIEEEMPLALRGVLNATNQGLQYTYNSSSINSEVSSLGFRYNLTQNSVLKFQYDYLQEKDLVSYNTKELIDVNVHVFSSAVNFIF